MNESNTFICHTTLINGEIEIELLDSIPKFNHDGLRVFIANINGGDSLELRFDSVNAVWVMPVW